MAEALTADLERAVMALVGKQDTITRYMNYYDGEQPVVYSNARLKAIFAGLNVKATENFCAPVIDATADRINLTGFTTDNEEVTATLDALWDELDLAQEADDVHTVALVAGESYLVIWKEDQAGIQAYYCDPRMAHVFYDANNPHVKAFAVKWWDDEAYYRRLILYYADRLEYYVSIDRMSDGMGVTEPSQFRRDPTLPAAKNPYGEVPVFHFRPNSRIIKSDLKDVLPIQDPINKLNADMLVVAEFAAFPMRFIVSNADGTETLESGPGKIWTIKPGMAGMQEATQVGQLAAAQLDNYLMAKAKLIGDLCAITRTPRYYIFGENGVPSGESLQAQEAPLVKKVQDRTLRFDPTWRQASSFALKLSGQDVHPSRIKPVWTPAVTVQPLTTAQMHEANAKAGMPLATSLRRDGWSKEDLAQMEKDRAAETATATPPAPPPTTITTPPSMGAMPDGHMMKPGAMPAKG